MPIRHRLYFKAVLGGLFLISQVIPNLVAQNLVPNGDFESSSPTEATNWKTTGSNKVPEISSDAGFIRGQKSLHIKHPDESPGPERNILVSTAKPLTGIQPGKDYTLSFYAKSPVARQSLTVFFMTNADKKPHWYKKKAFILSENWTRFEFTQRLPNEKDWDNRKLSIRFDVPYGEIYLDDVDFETSKKSAVSNVSEIQEHKNLLHNPGLELGWLGWSMIGYKNKALDYEKPEIPSDLDHKEKFEGTASIRVEPRSVISTERYPIVPDEKYTFSFYAKAASASGPDHKVTFYILTSNWKRVSKTLVVGEDLGSNWNRYSITFSFPDQGAAFRNAVYFRLDTKDNTVWIDAAQLEKGEKATIYESTLQASLLTDSKTGLFSLDRPGQVNVALTGTGGIPKPVTVTLTARDWSSNVVWTANIPFKPTSNEFVTVPLALENKVLGVMDLTTEVKAAGEPTISMNRSRYCVINGSTEGARLNPLFGMENGIGGTPAWQEEHAEGLARAAGAGFSRVFIWYGDDGGGEENTDSLRRLKEQLERKKKSGKTVMICVNRPKGMFLYPQRPMNRDATEEEVQKDLELYAKYAGHLAGYLRDTVDYYQILNEPNIWNAQGAKAGTRLIPAERYLKFLKAGSEAIKKAYPEAKVVGNVNGLANEYVEKLFSLGAAHYLDAFTFHSYRIAPEVPPAYEGILKFKAIIDKYAKGMKLFNDEQYFGVRDFYQNQGEDLKDYYSDSEEDQAGRILQNFLHHIASAQIPYSVFSVHCTLFRQGMSHPTHFYYAYGGYRFMSQTLYDITHGATIELHPAIRSFQFERKDGQKIVTLNTRMYGVKGGVRESGADEAFDGNGNKLDPKDVSISFVPIYLFYKGTLDEISAKLKKADFYGFDSPVRASVDGANGKLSVDIENYSNRNVDALLKFTKFPKGWKTPAPLDLKAMDPKSKKHFDFDIPETTFDWSKDYTVEYTVVAGDSIVNKNARLASIFSPKKTMTVDGDLEDWKGLPSMELGENHLSPDFSDEKYPHKGPQDLSANVAVSWDENNFYCAVKVKDDHFFPGPGANFWLNDSVQLYFDLQNDAGKFYDDNDAVYSVGLNKEAQPVAFLEKNPTGRYVGADNTDTGIDTDVKVAFKKLADGYVYEIAIPKVALPTLDFKEGSKLGFSVLVNDNDGEGRKQGVTLGSQLTEPTRKPFLWKTIKLMP